MSRIWLTAACSANNYDSKIHKPPKMHVSANAHQDLDRGPVWMHMSDMQKLRVDIVCRYELGLLAMNCIAGLTS